MNHNTRNNPQKPLKPSFNYFAVVLVSIPGLAVAIKGIVSNLPIFIILGLAVIIVSLYIAFRNYSEAMQKYNTAMKNYENEIDKRETMPEEHISLSQDNTVVLADTVFPESTPFQDVLKHSAQTKEEYKEGIKNQRHQKALQQATDDAEGVMNVIHNQLVHLAQIGDYAEENGKRIIRCLIPLPEYYLGEYSVNDRKFYRDRLTDAMIGKDEKTCRQLLKTYNRSMDSASGKITTFKIAIPFEETYTILIGILKERAGNDGITIEPLLYNTSENCTYSMPCVVKEDECSRLGQSFLAKTQCKLFIKCSCEIPEKYSSDVPIFASADETKPVTADSDIYSDNNPVIIEDKPDEIEIDDMDGWQFEEYCSKLLTKNGFERVMVTSGSGDQGVDIIAEKDGIKYGIQCKFYKSDVGNKAVQEAYSGKAFYGCHVGVVLTNSYFTRSAYELAERNGILLWDRSKLQELIKNTNRKCKKSKHK